MKKKKHIKYKDCNSTIAQLISAEELISVYNLKAAMERKQNRMNRRKNKKVHNK